VNAPAEWSRGEAELAAGAIGRFVLPRYGGRSLPNLTRSLWAATGRELPAGPGVPPLDPALDPLGGRRAEGPIVVLLVDSLGWRSFRRSMESASAVTRSIAPAWAESARPITTVFPTTTTSALTSLSTGTAPAQHGIAGHRLYLPRYGAVIDLLRMTPSSIPGAELIVGPEWSPRELSAVPTVFEAGLPAAVVSRDRFSGTGFTRLLYTGAEYVPYWTASDLAFELAGVLSRARPPEVVFVYWDELDTVQHRHGPEPFLFDLELARIDQLLRAVAGALTPAQRRGIQLWVTGDHGQVTVDPKANLALERHPALLEALRYPLAGDRRAGFFSIRPAREASFRAAVEAELPSEGRSLPMEEALARGLFGPGPFHPELGARLGELLVLPAAPAGITYQPPGYPPPLRTLSGAHGGLEPEELWVPLVAAPFDRFAAER
jgi:hypothetical protein